MRRISQITGFLGSAAALSVMYFPIEAEGAIWIPGTLSLLLGAISLFCSSREQGRHYLPGISAMILYLGSFLIPMIAISFSDVRGVALLLLPFLACVLLIGIHTYFGIHVIARGIIFVDLSLAQVAALGTVVAFASGVALHTTSAYFYSLVFALIGAFIFSLSRLASGRVSQEAVIGIVYAVATAAAMLLVDKIPEGMELIKGSLTGHIMWVDAGSIVSTSRIYSIIAVFHLLLFGKFIVISRDSKSARKRGINIRLWDLLFYITFGIVITKSVEISGILLVFSFLVIPAIISSLFLDELGKRLATGWILGTVASVIGLVASYNYDLAAGPTIVSILTCALVLAGLVRFVSKAETWTRALIKAGLGMSFLAAILLLLYVNSPLSEGVGSLNGHMHSPGEETVANTAADADSPGHPKGSHALHLIDHYLDDPDDPQALEALQNHLGGLIMLLQHPSPEVREKAASVLGVVGDGPMLEKKLEKAFTGEEDEWVRFEIAASLFKLDRKKGGKLLLDLMSNDESPVFIKDQSVDLLREATGDSFGFGPETSGEANRSALREWNELLEKL